MPRSKSRSSVRTRQAREVRHRQENQQAKRTPREYARRRFLGWGLVIAGAAIGITHYLEHLGALPHLSGVVGETALGYPMAALLAIGGAIILSK